MLVLPRPCGTSFAGDPERAGPRSVVAWCPDKWGEELPDAGVGLVADAADDLDGLAGGVLELPFLVALAPVEGQASPQPIVITALVGPTARRRYGLAHRAR